MYEESYRYISQSIEQLKKLVAFEEGRRAALIEDFPAQITTQDETPAITRRVKDQDLNKDEN